MEDKKSKHQNPQHKLVQNTNEYIKTESKDSWIRTRENIAMHLKGLSLIPKKQKKLYIYKLTCLDKALQYLVREASPSQRPMQH